jgi:hypothetical protein
MYIRVQNLVGTIQGIHPPPQKKTKPRGLSLQANYTDQATAAVGEVVPTFCG